MSRPRPGPLTTDQLWSLATLLKQWREHIDHSLRTVEGRRWRRKSLLNIYKNYRGMVRDFSLINALRVSVLEALEMAYLIKSMEEKDGRGEKTGGRGKR
jgi:hypothetical protein